MLKLGLDVRGQPHRDPGQGSECQGLGGNEWDALGPTANHIHKTPHVPPLQEPKTERVLANLGVRVERVVAECQLPACPGVPKCFL